MAASCYEIVRYHVADSGEDEFRSAHDGAVRAIRERFPELLNATLARSENDEWLDVWRWQSMAAAKQAAQELPSIPEGQALMAHITEVVSMEHAEIVDES